MKTLLTNSELYSLHEMQYGNQLDFEAANDHFFWCHSNRKFLFDSLQEYLIENSEKINYSSPFQYFHARRTKEDRGIALLERKNNIRKFVEDNLSDDLFPSKSIKISAAIYLGYNFNFEKSNKSIKQLKKEQGIHGNSKTEPNPYFDLVEVDSLFSD